MAKKKNKKAVIKRRTIKDFLGVEGFLRLENLQSFCIDSEEEGLKDITLDLKELNGQYVKITINVVEENDLSEIGFSSLNKEEE